MIAIKGQAAHHGRAGFRKWRSARPVVMLVVLGAVAAFASVARASSLPALIAYQGPDGIGVVHPGHVHSARTFYTVSGTGLLSPKWSPNGETLAFGFNAPQGVGIGLLDRSGRPIAHFLVYTPVLGRYPPQIAWSPNGKEIAYPCFDGPILMTPSSSPFVPPNQFLNMCVLDVVTGAHRVLADSTLAEGIPSVSTALTLSWSSRSDEIAVDGLRDIAPGNCTGFGCGQPNIALADVATGTMTSLGGSDNFGEPEFSRNGSEIAVMGHPRGGVYIMSASGGGARQVASTGFQQNWSPNGKELVFEQLDAASADNNDLFTVDAEGGTPKQATDVSAAAPSWVGPVTRCTVPKLKGQTLAAAKRLVALAGCTVGKVTGPKKNRSKRHVVNQKPTANDDVAVGTKVNIQLR